MKDVKLDRLLLAVTLEAVILKVAGQLLVERLPQVPRAMRVAITMSYLNWSLMLLIRCSSGIINQPKYKIDKNIKLKQSALSLLPFYRKVCP